MRGWFQAQDDLREEFPIEHLPLEILGNERRDALSLLYQRKKEGRVKSSSSRFPVKEVGLDQQKMAFFKKIFPILDGFDQLFKYGRAQNIEGDEILSNWFKTLESLYRRLLSALEKEGLVAIESMGKPLDLSLYEVLEAREAPGFPHNTVIEEVVKGYRYGPRILRDAKVIMAKNPDAIGLKGNTLESYEEMLPEEGMGI